jgi:hypothetical protein
MTMTSTDPTTASPTTSRGRRIARRIVLTLVTVLPLLLTAGALAELLAGKDHGAHRFHDFSHVVWLGALVCTPYALQWRRPERRVALWQGAAVGAVVLLVAGASAGVADPVFYVAFPLFATLVAVTHPARGRLLAAGAGLSAVLAPIAAVAAIPASLYAADQLGLQRAHPHDLHGELTHYVGQAVVVLFAVVFALVASLRSAGWQWAAGLASASGLALGVASIIGPDQPGAWRPAASAAVIALSAAYGMAAWWEHRRG